MKIIAIRPDGCQLIETTAKRGYILDPSTGKKSDELPIESLLSRGYWANYEEEP